MTERPRERPREIPFPVLIPPHIVIMHMWYGGEAGIEEIAELYRWTPEQVIKLIQRHCPRQVRPRPVPSIGTEKSHTKEREVT